MRKLTIASLCGILSLSIAIIIRAHCGSSWEFSPPSFSPTLNVAGCLHGSSSLVGDNPTQTTKTVRTEVFFLVGPSQTIPISDFGQNRRDGTFLGTVCTRCFPDFFTPQFDDIGGGVTEWSQVTRAAVAISAGSCAPNLGPGPTVHHFGRNCNPSEEECEEDFFWTWNFTNSTCEEPAGDVGNCGTSVLMYSCDPGQYWDTQSCVCEYDPSPILVDLGGDGFNLTDKSGGVNFDLNSNGFAEKLSWTSLGADDAWLALDRNGNGTIDNGRELFGNYTPQPEPPQGEQRNGFLALAEYDKVSNGGNGDGVITEADTIFNSLQLWRDVNHNGVSEAGELFPLQSAQVATLELQYKASKYRDQYGNEFRYRAKVKDTQGTQVGRWMWDVFLVRNP